MVAATLTARVKGYYEDEMMLRVQSEVGFMDMLYQVDKSHVPMPDEPPIVYPDAERWKELTASRKERYSSMSLAKQNSAEKRIEAALKSPTDMEFVELPLDQVIDYLKDYHQIEIQLDKTAMDDVGIETDTPVTKNLKGITLRSGLRLMLRELKLTYVIQDEVLLITTPETAEAHLTTKVYPVADLVLPIKQLNMSGMGGLGGGLSGSMMGGNPGGGGMGMGGGMGGGGMGGMGMGGGGMGMGGMGGGMFNVPVEVVPQVPVDGFYAFAVKAEDTPAADAPAKIPAPAKIEAPAKIAAAASRPETIPWEKLIAAGGDASATNAVWEKYFSANEPQEAAIRAAVRGMMSGQKFDHVIALIEAALRHHQSQPWMYEALALAMQAADRPPEQIERAVMSAVDFIDNPTDLMYLGVYLTQLGLDQRRCGSSARWPS